MAENMMNSAHKATNKAYRDNYTKVFDNAKKGKESESTKLEIKKHE